MNLKYSGVLILWVAFFVTSTSGQGVESRGNQGYEINRAAIAEIQKEHAQVQKNRKARVKAYMNKHRMKSAYLKQDGVEMALIDVVNDKPVYYTTHNDASVASLGVNELREGGSLGLNLTGVNTNIAIWDSGISRNTHQEFEGRLINNDSGSDFSDHSTHVMGTLLAGGTNPGAKGFLPDANAQSYDWFDDTQEVMNALLGSNLLASNHSYGLVMGWGNNGWNGDPTISNVEDWRFGYYSGDCATFDNIMYNAPYYTVVKSAGNDRGDSGSGNQPADGPYDCIGDFGVAKNVITIGAVQKLNGAYTGPSDVVMSSFSGWGPVDDGRIKPDFVAPGVNLFSCTSSDDEDYSSFSGTSMASPSATGAFALINEAYALFNNRFMKAATVKALVASTIREAGNSDGPDYEFGYGLIAADKAVDFIIDEDGVNRHIIETTLSDQGVFEFELNPQKGKKITATVAWTDPNGSPPQASLDPTDLMLVNDLDMIIVDDFGNEVNPWILNPSSPGIAATRGDNFRDNMEKIEFNDPEARKYTLRISHKGTLVNSAQDFSLIIDYTSEDPGVENLYWVSDDGNWGEGGNWSSQSNGTPEALSPNMSSKLIFDDNSFDADGGVNVMNQNYTVNSIVALSSKDIIFDLGGNTLTVEGNAFIGSSTFTIRNGTLLFSNVSSEANNRIDLNGTTLENVNIEIGSSNNASWLIENSVVDIPRINHLSGPLLFSNSTVKLDTLMSSGDLQIERTSLSISQLTIDGSYEDDMVSELNFLPLNEANNLMASGVVFNSGINTTGELNLLGASTYRFVQATDAKLTINDDVVMDSLYLLSGADLTFDGSNGKLTLTELHFNGDSQNSVSVMGVNNEIIILNHSKFCFDFIDVEGVSLMGSSSVSVGINGSVTNAQGWFVGACEDLLFANYSSNSLCTNGISFFTNSSEGEFEESKWYIDNSLVASTNDLAYVFEASGSYDVRLEVSKSGASGVSYSQAVEIVESEIEPNSIVQNTTSLASLKPGDAYQWYKDDLPIEGATARTLPYNGESGVYFVLIFKDGCNRKSETFSLSTSIINADGPDSYISVFPNPIKDRVQIEFNIRSANAVVKLFDIVGRQVYHKDYSVTVGDNIQLEVKGLLPGIYNLTVQIDDDIFYKKLVK